MHAENCRIDAPLAPPIVRLPPLLGPPLPLEVPRLVGGESEEEPFVVVEPAPATDGEEGLPPHAATVRARQRAAALVSSALIRFMHPEIAAPR